MSPLLYLVIGLIGGGFLVAVIALLTRRETGGGDVEAELVKRLEVIDRGLRDEFSRNREEAGTAAKAQREELGKSLESVRSIVDLRLKQLQEDNSKQIDKMRATVDEKLQGTLEKRLGESFKLVSERLEQVHQGLGAMRQLASDVGGLQKVLANVKTRGGWGEVQLGALLEQVLTADQFARNVKTREESGENVDFAIKLPGDENGAPVWLPIDAKFPTEDYQRLLAAQEAGNVVAVEDAMKGLETQLKKARKIFARNISIRRARPISRSCFCRRKDFTRKRSGASVWSSKCSAIVGWSLPGRRRWRRCSTVCKWVFARSRFKSVPVKFGICSPELKPSSENLVKRYRR